MTRFNSLNIKQKLTLVLLLTISAGVVLNGTFFMVYERYQTRDQLRHEIEVVSKVAYSQIVAALDFNDASALQESAGSINYDESIDRVCLYNQDLELMANSAAEGVLCPDQPRLVQPGFHGDYFHYVENVMSGDVPLGVIYIRATTDFIETKIQRYFIMTLSVLALIAAMAMLVALALQKSVTSPLSELARTAATITEHKDYSVRATRIGQDELGQLVNAFNAMLDTIELRDRELRQHKVHLEQIVSERTSELKAANRELEAFSYSVSHDLRSPLRAIDGFSQALLEDYSETLDDTGKSYLERVRLASQRMGVLIDSLLRLSRVTRHELVLQDTDISLMCEEVIEDLRERNREREVEFSVQPGMIARCDRTLIRIALTNLLDNAWKYTRKQELPRVDVGVRNGEYFIADNGAGFDMRYADKLFMAFQRLHSSDEFEGTGIGLATTARVIRRHGGDIRAESEPGKGTAFYFSLPG